MRSHWRVGARTYDINKYVVRVRLITLHIRMSNVQLTPRTYSRSISTVSCDEHQVTSNRYSKATQHIVKRIAQVHNKLNTCTYLGSSAFTHCQSAKATVQSAHRSETEIISSLSQVMKNLVVLFDTQIDITIFEI